MFLLLFKKSSLSHNVVCLSVLCCNCCCKTCSFYSLKCGLLLKKIKIIIFYKHQVRGRYRFTFCRSIYINRRCISAKLFIRQINNQAFKSITKIHWIELKKKTNFKFFYILFSISSPFICYLSIHSARINFVIYKKSLQSLIE